MTSGALTRFRVMAWVTGVMLLVLVFVAMPMKYLGDDESLDFVAVFHGTVLYPLYVLASLHLAYQGRWSLSRTIVVVLLGAVPFAFFFADRKVVQAAQRERVQV